MNDSMQSRRIQDDDNDISIECYQNYTAPEVFIQGLAGIVNQQDVAVMIRAQKQMLQRFEKTNEMLLNCNALSQSRLKQAQEDFKKHVKSLHEMKKDLDYIFKKIRSMKAKLSSQYPQAYIDALPQSQATTLAEEAEDDEVNKEETPSSSNPNSQEQEKKDEVTVQYVKMEERPNDSDCTSEETG
ncbi:KXD1 family protein [Megaselia abdita]